MSNTLLTAIILAVIIIGVGVAVYTIKTTGVIKTVDVKAYLDLELTKPATDVDWGKIGPGENKTITIYIQSISNVPAICSLTVNNTNPVEIKDYLTTTWDIEGITIEPGEVKEAKITLAVSPSLKYRGSFSFDIYITASG